MITSHLKCFYDKNIMFERKKTVTETCYITKTLTNFRILKDFKRIIKFRNYLPLENLSMKC